MPWREAMTRVWPSVPDAKRLLVGVLIVGSAVTGLGGTNASVSPGPDRFDLLPPVTTTSSTTTTTVPLHVDVAAPAPVVLPARLTPAQAGRALTAALAELLPGRGAPLPPDVALFAAQVTPASDVAAAARSFIGNRYANLIAHRRQVRAASVGPVCRVVVGPDAWSEPAHRLPLECR